MKSKIDMYLEMKDSLTDDKKRLIEILEKDERTQDEVNEGHALGEIIGKIFAYLSKDGTQIKAFVPLSWVEKMSLEELTPHMNAAMDKLETYISQVYGTIQK